MTVNPTPLFLPMAVEIFLMNLVFVTPWILKDPPINGKFSYFNLYIETWSPRVF